MDDAFAYRLENQTRRARRALEKCPHEQLEHLLRGSFPKLTPAQRDKISAAIRETDDRTNGDWGAVLSVATVLCVLSENEIELPVSVKVQQSDDTVDDAPAPAKPVVGRPTTYDGWLLAGEAEHFNKFAPAYARRVHRNATTVAEAFEPWAWLLEGEQRIKARIPNWNRLGERTRYFGLRGVWDDVSDALDDETSKLSRVLGPVRRAVALKAVRNIKFHCGPKRK